jgi:hypothetical protein
MSRTQVNNNNGSGLLLLSQKRPFNQWRSNTPIDLGDLNNFVAKAKAARVANVIPLAGAI